MRVLREMEVAGVRLDTRAAGGGRARVRDEAAALEREIWDLAGEEFMIGSPQQLGEVLFVKLGLSRKRRGKTGFSTDARVLQAIRDEHAIIPKIERWRELNKLAKTYLDVLPAADRPRRPPAHDVPAGERGDRPALLDQPQPAEHPGAHRAGPRDPRLLRVAEPGNVLISADYSQVELRVLAHIADEPVLKEIFLRGEDVHTATAVAGLRQGARGARPVACARRRR